MSQLSDANLTEQRSLDNILNAPKREEPLGFLLRLAKALHTYGLPAYELEKTMNGCAEAMGYGIQCMSLPTSISITLLPPDGNPQTFLIRVSPGEINIERLRKTTRIARDVINGELGAKKGALYLREIASFVPYYPQWVIVLAFGVVSACIARIFSGSFSDMAVSGIIGLVVGIIAVASKTRPMLDHLLPAISAFIATFVTLFINHYFGLTITTSIVVVSGLIILLPGLSLTIALAELATQNLVSGTARLSGTATTFIQLAFGSVLGAEVSSRLGFMVTESTVSAVPAWSVWLAVSIASLALVPLFSARKQDVGWFLLSALTAFTTVYFATQAFGASLGAFLGAITIGVMAKLVSRFFDIPGATIMMPGFIILVPGAVGYRSVLALAEKDMLAGLSTAFDVGVIGISLVAGFLISSLVPLPKNDAKDSY